MAANAVEFVLKARNEATREIERVSGGLGKLSGSVSKVVGAAGGLAVLTTTLAAIGAGVYAASKKIGDAAEELDRTSRSAGTSAAQMQAMRLAFSNAGLSADDAALMMTKLNQAIGRGDPMLKQLGITTTNAYDAFQQLGRIFASSDDAAKKALVTQTLLGKGMATSSGIVADLADGTREAQAVLARYGATMDTAAMRQGLALDARMDALNTRMAASTDALKKKLTPALVELVGVLNDVLDGVGRAANAFSSLDAEAEAWNKRHKPGEAPKMMSAHGAGSGLTMMSAHGAVAAGGNSLSNVGKGYVIIGYDTDGTPIWGPKPAKAASGGVNVGGRMMSFVHGEGFENPQTGTEYYAAQTKRYFATIAKGLKTVEVPANKLGRTGEIVAAKLAMVDGAFDTMASAVASSIQNTVSAVFSGTVSIGGAFQMLMGGILRTIAEAAAQLGIGIGLSVLGLALGGPVGAFIGTVGSRIGGFAVAPTTGVNVNINAIDRSSITRSLTSPRGELRQAMSTLARSGAY